MEPFAPPEERSSGESLSGATIAGTWAIAGAVLGTAVGGWLHAFRYVGDIVSFGIGGALLVGLLGWLAWRRERAAARARPSMVDGRGRLVQPLSSWLIGVPLLLGSVGLAALVVLVTLRTRSYLPGALLLVSMLGLGAMARPLLGRRSLTRAVEALESGRVVEGRKRLEAIAGRVWAPPAVRQMAALNLGLQNIAEGDLEAAGDWYEQAGAFRGRPLAATGLALVRVLQDRYPEAETLLHGATLASQRSAQAEIDAVRLLLILRRDGAAEARSAGETMAGPGSGALFLAILAAVRHASGDERGARELVEQPAVEDALQSGIAQAVPELRGLRYGAFDAL